jgi:hypothetical protein
MTEIIGQPEPPGSGNPVELRAMQIWGTTLGDDLGVPASPVYGTFVPGSGTYFWQYYQVSLEDTTINGMIACEIGGCSCVLYGPIYDYYDAQQQFEGPLGFPTSDVTQLPDVTISGGGGSGATATMTLGSQGAITGVTVTDGGSGYTSAPTVTVNTSTGSGAVLTATVDNGVVTGITVTNGGSGYAGLYYAVFDNGVIYEDAQGDVVQLHALSPTLLQALTQSSSYPSGISGTIGQITQIAQQKVQSIANNAVQTNPMLSMYVSSILAQLTFNGVGQGACANLNALGSISQGAVCREHIYDVNLVFILTGCAGVAGGASADMTVTLQLVVNPPNVQAFLRNYTINNVGSPFGAANGIITAQLNLAMADQYGKDLLNAPSPSGFSAIAVIVDTQGNVNVYILPTCSASSLMLMRRETAQSVLARLRNLRDAYILHKSYGRDLITIVEVIGPLLIERLRREDLSSQGTGVELLTTAATIISDPNIDTDAFKRELDEVCERLVELLHTLEEEAQGATVVDHMLDVGVEFVRERTASAPSATAALQAFKQVLVQELERGTRRRR